MYLWFDADLIILSLSNIDCKNIYLCRELPEELMKYKHLSWNQMDENSVQLFMDMGIHKGIIILICVVTKCKL